MLRFLLLSILLTLFIATNACGPGAPSEELSAEPSASATKVEVRFEPAYPEEVSSEGLTAEDVAQQEAGHSHSGDGVHAHEEAGHSHEEVEDHHEHDDGR